MVSLFFAGYAAVVLSLELKGDPPLVDFRKDNIDGCILNDAIAAGMKLPISPGSLPDIPADTDTPNPFLDECAAL